MAARELPANLAFTIPYEVMIDTRLTLAARVLFAEILALSFRQRYCYAKNQHFAQVLGISVRTVCYAIKQLQQLEYVEVAAANTSHRTIRVVDKFDKPRHRAVQELHTGTQKLHTTTPNLRQNQIPRNYSEAIKNTKKAGVKNTNRAEAQKELMREREALWAGKSL